MSLLQIILLSVSGLFAVLSIVFMIAFLVEINSEEKEVVEAEVKSIYSSENYVSNNDNNVDDMLANLDKQAEEAEPQVVNQVINLTINDVEEPQEVVETEEVVEETAETEEVVEETAETEEVVEETAEESVEIEDVAETIENKFTDEDDTDEDDQPALVDDSTIVETINPENLLDYKARLEKVKSNKDKLEKDLTKIEKSILNYERTKRRMNRNQKMLDRRASELTNLNLVMYSVTDIKNVDEDKKVKQEELTSHIAELKASIQDADEFLESNKEKNDHNVKMAKFLNQERNRFIEEIAALEDLIAKTENAENVG